MFGKSFCSISHCYAVCCAMKSMLLACQACEWFYSNQYPCVFYVRRYFSNFSYGIESNSIRVFHVDHTAHNLRHASLSLAPPHLHTDPHSLTHFLVWGSKQRGKQLNLCVIICLQVDRLWLMWWNVLNEMERDRQRAREHHNNSNKQKKQHSYICTTGKIPLRNWCVRLISPVLFGMFDDVRCTSGQMLKHFFLPYMYVYVCVNIPLSCSLSPALSLFLPLSRSFPNLAPWPFNIWFVSCAYLSCSTSDKTICPMWTFLCYNNTMNDRFEINYSEALCPVSQFNQTCCTLAVKHWNNSNNNSGEKK